MSPRYIWIISNASTRQIPPRPIASRILIQVATLVLAETSLGDDYVPTDFLRCEAEKRLENSKLTPAATFVDRLVDNGVLRKDVVAGVEILRFQLDPVAEHLGAIRCCREYASMRLTRKPGTHLCIYR